MEDLLSKVKQHHCIVEDHLPQYSLVMTVLIGSNNYHLDTPDSDIDTFTFILPSAEDLAFAREPRSGEFEVEDGKCMYKDIRLALNLLKKTSPNSVECFVGKYRYYEPKYQDIVKKYLENRSTLNLMAHCNYGHMLYAMAGMAHQLTKRNMPAGKRYSHALRLYSMVDVFTESLDTTYLLELLPRDYEEAYKAKRDQNTALDSYYDEQCNTVSALLDKRKEEFELSEFKVSVQEKGLRLIEDFQKELMQYYLKYIL